jgi:hypothetical protein
MSFLFESSHGLFSNSFLLHVDLSIPFVVFTKDRILVYYCCKKNALRSLATETMRIMVLTGRHKPDYLCGMHTCSVHLV